MTREQHTVEIEEGDKFTSFRITPTVALARLAGLPRPNFFGSEGPDTIDFHGIWEERDGASMVAFESWALGSQSTHQLTDYADAIISHLDSPSSDTPPPIH